MVTITGANLGRSFNQIQNAVKVAGKPCVVISDQYKISIQYVCSGETFPIHPLLLHPWLVPSSGVAGIAVCVLHPWLVLSSGVAGIAD